MAKKKEPAADPVALDPEDRAIVRQVIQDIVGCGIPDAESRLSAMDGATVAKILELENAGERSQIVAILFA